MRILAELYSADDRKTLCADTLEKISEIYFTKLQFIAVLLDGDASMNSAQKQLYLDFESIVQMLSVFEEKLLEKGMLAERGKKMARNGSGDFGIHSERTGYRIIG